ncbi:hypothetical protein PtA15_1A306 [Puccinia triticina]|uniref:GPI ethanolamine phosphate transferase 2 C-terminal domain-containing protein n=1 Tax=Puccinia triticina TaxID=208348 RepID=A0ABY7C9C4_9BASI|nr:uncharacterized protein PtA15_1A306 [Puccinia triticina]WAQ80968.1 hypothetical protein PtA15_1A306 [Puccinia triticina]
MLILVLIVLLIDALRTDFLLASHSPLALPRTLTIQHPAHSLLFHFRADPPTTTLQRLKAIATGSLPTFIDFSANFAATNLRIQDDSWPAQLRAQNKTIAFAGDDTWTKLFPGTTLFHPNLSAPFESFNVHDLHTVDTGVQTHFSKLLGNTTEQWDVLIGHVLGLDHAGHRFGAAHPSIHAKLAEYDRFLARTVAAMDAETLLVVMGDHGMDPKGDHGGDSFPEVSTALWLYSAARPLRSTRPMPDWVLDPHADWLDLEGIGPTRTLFFRTPSPIDALLEATQTNSAQLLAFVERYARVSNDLLPHLPLLRSLHTHAATLSSEHADPATAFRAHRRFARTLLETARSIWARFVPGLMALGILTMLLSLLVALKLRAALQHSSRPRNAPIRTLLPAARAAGLLGLGLAAALAFATPSLLPQELSRPVTLLTGAALGAAIGVLLHRPHPPEYAHVRLLRRPAPATLVKLVPVALHAISLGSNSFTVWEDHVVPHLLAFAVVLPALVRGIGAPKPALRNRLLVFGLLFAICVRLIGLSTVCREEQHGGCSVTFYGSDTSSSAPAWVMSLAIPLAIGLPIVPAWFLGISDSYRGPASFFFGGLWRLALLCAVQHAISDYLLATHAPSMAASLAETAGWVKLLAARAAVVLSVLAGSIVWLILPVCIDVQRVEPEEAAAEKPRLLVIGFANVYGSSYLMFLAAVFAILFLLNDAFVDLAALEHALPNAVRSAATHNTPSGPALVPPCDLNMLTGLYLLGHLVFFGTGHQATFASVQWNAAFVGLTQAHPLLSPILVFLNSFAGFVLVVLALPLFGLWKFEPVINLHPPTEQRGGAEVRTLETQLVESQLTFLALQALLLLLNMLFIFHLRRHLMVWKVFSPRFILAAAALLASHILLLLGFNAFAWPALRSKVRRAFGPQLLA